MRRIYKLDARSGQVTYCRFPLERSSTGMRYTRQLDCRYQKYISQPGYNNDDTRNGKRPLFGWKGSGGAVGLQLCS